MKYMKQQCASSEAESRARFSRIVSEGRRHQNVRGTVTIRGAWSDMSLLSRRR